MRRIIRLKESDINRIVNRVLNETTGIESTNKDLMNKITTFSKNLSNDLGENIDVESVMDTSSCSIDDFQADPGTDSKGLDLLEKVKDKVKQLVQGGDINTLKNAFKSLKTKKEQVDNETLTEQVAALMVPFTLLGITAPLSLWLAIAAILLVILIWGIVWAVSWIPKSSGHGCSKVIKKRVRVRR